MSIQFTKAVFNLIALVDAVFDGLQFGINRFLFYVSFRSCMGGEKGYVTPCTVLIEKQIG